MSYLISNKNLSLTKIFLFIKILCLLIFTILAIEINYVNNKFSWDNSILFYIHNQSNSFFDKLAPILTNFGGFKLILLFSFFISLSLFIKKQKRLLIYLVTSIFTSAMVNFLIKIFFQRPRPNLWESSYAFPSDSSFPSGHAMGSITLALTLLIIFWGSRWTLLLTILALFYIIAIAWTRLYLGVHYPSDILGGWLLGISWTTLIILLSKPRKL